MASDEVTIDVGPVWCPSCKREFGSTERDAEVSALRAALDVAVEALEEWKGEHLHCGRACITLDRITALVPDALGRYPKEASDG